MSLLESTPSWHFLHTEGIHNLRHQLEELSSKIAQAEKGASDMTTDALGHLENYIRGEPKPCSEDGHPSTSQPPTREDKR